MVELSPDYATKIASHRNLLCIFYMTAIQNIFCVAVFFHRSVHNLIWNIISFAIFIHLLKLLIKFEEENYSLKLYYSLPFKVVWHICKTSGGGGGVLKRNKVIVTWNDSLWLIANYEKVAFIAIMQCFFYHLHFVLHFCFSHFCFSFLNWTVLSSKTFRAYSSVSSHLQKKIHGDLECLQMYHNNFKDWFPSWSSEDPRLFIVCIFMNASRKEKLYPLFFICSIIPPYKVLETSRWIWLDVNNL